MKRERKIVVLVPNCNGGIDRLFEKVEANWINEADAYTIHMFKTHGRSMFGQSFLPFQLVYKSSALFYIVFALPYRLLKFTVMCATGNIKTCHINLSSGGSTVRKVLFARICRAFGVKYFIHLHGGSYPKYFSNISAKYRRTVQKFYANAAGVIVLGNVWRDFVVQAIGVDSKIVHILPNAVDGPRVIQLKKRAEPPQILFLGRIFAPKGIEELISALSSDDMKNLNWTAKIAGDGELAEYRRRVKKLGLSGKVDLPGWLDSDAVTNLLTQSTIFVLPSHVENLPLSMLEAMAHGLCPVVTPVGAVEDVIENGRNGILVPVGDANALSDALTKLIRNPELTRQLGDSARRDFLASYDIDGYQEKLQNIYRQALSK